MYWQTNFMEIPVPKILGFRRIRSVYKDINDALMHRDGLKG